MFVYYITGLFPIWT